MLSWYHHQFIGRGKLEPLPTWVRNTHVTVKSKVPVNVKTITFAAARVKITARFSAILKSHYFWWLSIFSLSFSLSLPFFRFFFLSFGAFFPSFFSSSNWENSVDWQTVAQKMQAFLYNSLGKLSSWMGSNDEVIKILTEKW